MTIEREYISLVKEGPLFPSSDNSSGAIQLTDAFVKEKGLKMIDVRPKSERTARGESSSVMRMLVYK